MERAFEEEENQAWEWGRSRPSPDNREPAGLVGGGRLWEMLDVASCQRVLSAKVGCLCWMCDVWGSALKF